MSLSSSHLEGPEAAHFAVEQDHILGADEVGRGALAGPLTVAAVAFPAEVFKVHLSDGLEGVTDSKLLSPARRAELVPCIRQKVAFFAVVHVSNRIVDRIGINPATRFALERLIARFESAGFRPKQLLLDGRHDFHIERFNPTIECRTIIGGDSASLSIAAASILAKESRDARMLRYASIFPEFGFDRHKGYGTRDHQRVLDLVGPCVLHRRTFLRGENTQLELEWPK